MTKANFVFLAAVLLILGATPLIEQIDPSVLNIITVSIILILGIPHGAIDNVLFLDKTNHSPLKFYSLYLGAILLNVILWLFFPIFSILLFLGISAFHFGQAQFNTILKSSVVVKNIFYFIWGTAVLMGFFSFNADDLKLLFRGADDLNIFLGLIDPSHMKTIFLTSSILTVVFMIVMTLKSMLPIENLVIEIIVLGLIYFTSYLFSFMISFMLFFTIIHSSKVLQQEYDHFYGQVNTKRILQFILKLLPFTVVSLIGIMLILGIIYFQLINLSYTLALIIAVSSITFPHVIVMDGFYKRKFFNKG